MAWETHIHRPREDRRSPAGDRALCGSLGGAYIVAPEGGELKEESGPYCPECRAAHQDSTGGKRDE